MKFSTISKMTRHVATNYAGTVFGNMLRNKFLLTWMDNHGINSVKAICSMVLKSIAIAIYVANYCMHCGSLSLCMCTVYDKTFRGGNFQSSSTMFIM